MQYFVEGLRSVLWGKAFEMPTPCEFGTDLLRRTGTGFPPSHKAATHVRQKDWSGCHIPVVLAMALTFLFVPKKTHMVCISKTD